MVIILVNIFCYLISLSFFFLSFHKIVKKNYLDEKEKIVDVEVFMVPVSLRYYLKNNNIVISLMQL